MLESETIPGLAGSSVKMSAGRKRAGSDPRPPASTEGTTMSAVLRELSALHTALSRQDLPSALLEQAFHQLMYLLAATTLNSLLLRKDMCCWNRGLQIRSAQVSSTVTSTSARVSWVRYLYPYIIGIMWVCWRSGCGVVHCRQGALWPLWSLWYRQHSFFKWARRLKQMDKPWSKPAMHCPTSRCVLYWHLETNACYVLNFELLCCRFHTEPLTITNDKK